MPQASLRPTRRSGERERRRRLLPRLRPPRRRESHSLLLLRLPRLLLRLLLRLTLLRLLCPDWRLACRPRLGLPSRRLAWLPPPLLEWL